MFAQLRTQLFSIWGRQSIVQRLVLITLVISAILLTVLFAMWANTPSFAVAFTGLSESDASKVVAKLDELGIEYQLRGTGTILVRSEEVYDVRLKMAREGLPQESNVGYEIFDSNTLGMTEFTQRINYQRALEGELERTIGSMAAIDAVRVHIVTPEKSLLSSEQAPTTASITVQLKPGMQLDSGQVQAITHLVGSSVEGMKPENVVVVDVYGNMLAAGEMDAGSASVSQTDSHRSAEMAAAADIQKKVQDLLDLALGPNRSVVKASVSMDWTQRETTQEAYDPAKSSIRSSQLISETYLTSGTTEGGIPGAATNLPPVVDTTGGEGSAADYRRDERTTNYEVTKTETKEVQAPGVVDRISLSVLVDGITDTVQLDKLQTVIAAAAGIQEARGDTLAVQSLAFDRTFYQAQAVELETSSRYDLYWRIGEVAAAVIILLGLLWYVQRLLSNLRLISTQAWTPIFKPVSEIALAAGKGPAGEAGVVPGLPGIEAGVTAEAGQLAAGAVPAAAAAPVPTAASLQALIPLEMQAQQMSEEEEQLQRLVIELAEQNPSTVAEIIQMWLNEER